MDETSRPASQSAPADPAAVGFTAEERRLVALLAGCAFLGVVNFVALTPFLPRVAADLGTTVPLVGQVTTVLTLGSALLGLAVGPFADARGHRRLILVGIVAVALNLAGMAVARSYGVLLPLSVLAAVGDALLFGLPYAVASDRFGDEQRRRAVAWVSGGLSLGIVAAPTLLALVGHAVGWRGALLVAAAVALCVVPLATALLPEDPPSPAGSIGLRSLGAAYRPILESRTMLCLFAASVLRAASTIGVLSYFGAFLTDRFDAGPSLVGAGYLGLGLGVLAGNVIAANLPAHVPLRPLTTASVAAASLLLGAAIMLVLPPVSTIAVAAASGVLTAISYVGITTMMTRETRAGTGTTMVLNGSMINLGTAVGAAVGGAAIALGGFALLGAAVPLFGVASAASVAVSSRRSPDA